MTSPPTVLEGPSYTSSPGLALVLPIFRYSHPKGGEGCPTVLLMCISIVTDNVRYIFISLVAASMSPGSPYQSCAGPVDLHLLVTAFQGFENSTWVSGLRPPGPTSPRLPALRLVHAFSLWSLAPFCLEKATSQCSPTCSILTMHISFCPAPGRGRRLTLDAASVTQSEGHCSFAL